VCLLLKKLSLLVLCNIATLISLPGQDFSAALNDDDCGALCYTFTATGNEFLHEWDFGDGTEMGPCYCPVVQHCYTNVNTYSNTNDAPVVTHIIINISSTNLTLDHEQSAGAGVWIGDPDDNVTPSSLSGFTALPGSSFNGMSNTRNVYVYGIVNVDKDFTFTAANLLFQASGGLNVVEDGEDNDYKLTLESSTDAGVLPDCPCMWRGIDVYGKLITKTGAELHDALYAVRPIKIGDQPHLQIRSTTFANNYISLMAANGNFLFSDTDKGFSGNQITTTANLKDWCDKEEEEIVEDPFSPSNDVFSDDQGWAGIYLNGISNFRIHPNTASVNTLSNLANGIWMVNSNADNSSDPGIMMCRFAQILRGNYSTDLGGFGIYFLDTEGTHFLDQLGLGQSGSPNPTFFECEVGIYAEAANGAGGSQIFSTDNHMDSVETGYQIENSVGNMDVIITENEINSNITYAHDPINAAGVWIQNNTNGNSTQIVDNNTILVNQPEQVLPFGVFIRGSFADTIGGNVVEVAENQIDLEVGWSGITFLDQHGAVAHENVITVSDAYFGAQGIYLGAGTKNYALCNNLQGPEPFNEYPFLDGINCFFAVDAKIRDNLINNFENGVHFDEPCGTDVDFRCNEIAGHNIVGLFYSASAVTGPQENKGNIWNCNSDEVEARNI
jgi:hypothetical protein